MRPLSLLRPPAIAALSTLAALAAIGCDSDSIQPNTLQLVSETPLVADASGLAGAAVVDPNLKNPWGIAINPTNGVIWVSNNHSGTSTVYQPNGTIVSLVVDIPSPTGPTGGKPTGIVFNSTADFVIPGSGAATFIFAGEDGIISAWNQTSGGARVVADRSAANAVYLGLTSIGSALFAANFGANTVEMFDGSFAFVKSFTDPGVPTDYGPFNVQSINGNLYVAYAKHDPATGEEAAGIGNGYVSVFGSDGTFLRRFASNGALNAPWGMAAAPSNFGSLAGAILVGNFGDGRINAFNANDGMFLGQLMGANGEVALEGLWGLAVGPSGNLYFAAGIQDEEHGLLGLIAPQP